MTHRHVTIIGNTGWNVIRFRDELIKGLLEAGWQVSAIAAFSREQQSVLSHRGVEARDIEIDAAGTNPRRDLAYARQLAACLRSLRPDLVHLFSIKPVIYGALAARLTGTPGIVASVTGAGVIRAHGRPWLGRGLEALMRVSLAGRPQVIFQNPDDLRAFVAKRIVPQSRATCIAGSGIDTDALVPDRVTPPERRRTFVMAARMLWSKGVEDFVTAARMVRREWPDATFVLVGGTAEDYGSKNADFVGRDWLESVHREGVVEWRGWTEPAVLAAAMRSAAAVVLPSYYAEGVPRTLIEAAAAGTPIITTDLAGCRDTVIEDRSGYLVPPRAPEALAAVMAKLLGAPEQITTLGEAGRRLAVARFDRRVVISATLEVYERALSIERGDGRTELSSI